MSLLIVQHPIFYAERVSIIWFIHKIWELFFSRNDMVWTIRGSYRLVEALPIIVIPFWKAMKHPTRDGCCSLQHVIPFSCVGRVPKVWLFILKFGSWFWQKWHYVRHDGSFMLSEAYLIVLIHLRKVLKCLTSNGCISEQHSIPFPVLKGCPKSDILMKFVSCFGQKWHGVDHESSYIPSEALPIILVHLTKNIKHSNSNGCISL